MRRGEHKEQPAVGAKFACWTMIGVPTPSHKGHYSACFRCDCGQVQSVDVRAVLRGASRQCRSCSARSWRKRPLGVEVRRNAENAHIYSTWKAVQNRTTNLTCASYKCYGARGIRCEFPDFLSFYTYVRALEGCRPGMQLDRIDNDRGYAPGNLRWATPKQQQRNKRNNHMVEYLGERMALSACIEKYAPGVPPPTVWARVRRGWPLEKALQS